MTAPTPAGQARADRGEADLIERVADELGEHMVRVFLPTGTGRIGIRCGCGWHCNDWVHVDDAAREHRLHMAAAAVEVLRGETR